MIIRRPDRPPPGRRCSYCRKREGNRWGGANRPACQLCIVRRELREARYYAERVPVLEAEYKRLRKATDAEVSRAGDREHRSFLRAMEEIARDAYAGRLGKYRRL